MTRKTVQGRPVKVGLLGGTFNPVHLAHLVVAQDALEQFGLDQIWFVPCARPPHKGEGHLAPVTDRLAMLKLALQGNPWASVCDSELKRGGVSYTVETVRDLKRLHPGVEFHFVLGTDSLAELHQWREIGALLDICSFIAIGRPGWDPETLDVKSLCLPPPWPGRLKANIRTGHMIGISSTEIRDRAAHGRSLRYLVPDAVAEYMTQKALYRAQETA
jgi:nicotinate-nucleotide adenylyltransferase